MGTEESAKFRCPVCQACFRNSPTCLRCGADLAPLQLLIDQAYRLRQRAKWALESGDVERAQEGAAEAEKLCSTQKGRELWLLSAWLLNEIQNLRPSSSPRQAAGTIPFTGCAAQLGNHATAAAPAPIGGASELAARFASHRSFIRAESFARAAGES